MKNFFQFLSESAAQQAARLGLQGDGEGDELIELAVQELEQA